MEQAGSRAGGEMRRASREGGTLEDKLTPPGWPGEGVLDLEVSLMSGWCGKEWRAGGDGHLGLGAGRGLVGCVGEREAREDPGAGGRGSRGWAVV